MRSKAYIGPYRNFTTNKPQTICNMIMAGDQYSTPPVAAGSGVTDCGTNGIGRQGGGNWLGYLGNVMALDNGNFVNAVGDPTAFWNTNSAIDPNAVGREDLVAQILDPNGNIVKDTWFVGTNANGNEAMDMNVSAFSGGFALRNEGTFYFHDDNGNITHIYLLYTNNPIPPATPGFAAFTSGFSLDRGDNTRSQSHINSHYVYMAGYVGSSTANYGYQLGVWDARTGLFITNAIINSDIGPLHNLGSGDDGGNNAELGVDEYDRVCVAFEGTPAGTIGWGAGQVMARVLKWNGANVSYLTPTFFPFLNSDNRDTVAIQGFAEGFVTARPSVAMTEDYICIAAKGLLNSTNNPLATPDTAAATTVYTVITAPEL
jgi:hypothetical protein